MRGRFVSNIVEQKQKKPSRSILDGSGICFGKNGFCSAWLLRVYARPVFKGRLLFFSLNCMVRLCRAAEAWTAALRYDGCIEEMAGETAVDGTGMDLRAISFMA